MQSVTRTYGWQPQLPDIRDHQFRATAPVTGLPESVDWRSWMPPVFDQGALGSCTAQSAAAALFMAQTKRGGDTVAGVVSRLFIYYNERLMNHTTRQDAGATIRDSMKSLATYGAVPEALLPYTIATFTKRPARTLYARAKSYCLVKEYVAVAQSLNAIQAAVAGQHPVCIGISVYESFESDAVASTGIVPMPGRNEQMLGGHAVLVVGYDNTNQAFLCRNSWGETWGLGGYFYLPYTYVLHPDLASDFWIINQL